MKPRSLLLVCFILFPAISPFAQSSGASADPIASQFE